MRHQKAGVHLSRTSAHRQALFSNLVAALFEHEKIRTTHAKAHATRRIAERTITIARRVGDVLKKRPEKRTPEEAARVVTAMRQARRVVRSRAAVQKLFEDLGPRFIGRHGGYTRIIKLGERPGDAAPMSLLELVEEAGTRKAATPDPEAKASKGKSKAPAATAAAAAPKAGKAAKTAAGAKASAAGKKSTRKGSAESASDDDE